MVDSKLAGAHYGLRDWAAQRVTAVLMIIYPVPARHVRSGRLFAVAGVF